MNEREMMLKKIGTYQFAITDIDLFLDTHPGDTEMLKKRNEYLQALAPLVKSYEEQFGPLRKSDDAVNRWAWVKDPWPWDMEG